MRTFKSKTNYIKSLVDNVVYENNTIYLGIYDKEENYEEATKEEYDEYIKTKEKTREEEMNANR